MERCSFSHYLGPHFRIKLPHKLTSLQPAHRAAEASLGWGGKLRALRWWARGLAPPPGPARPKGCPALSPLSGPTRLPLHRAEWTSPQPGPAPAPGVAAPDARQTVPPGGEEGVRLCGRGAQPAVSGAEARQSAAEDRSAAPHLGGAAARPRPCGDLSGRRERERAASPPAGSGGWARLRQSVRSEMAEPPRRGPRPRELGSRAAPGCGGARGQRGRRLVRRVSRP